MRARDPGCQNHLWEIFCRTWHTLRPRIVKKSWSSPSRVILRLCPSHFMCQGSPISIFSLDIQCDQNDSERLSNLLEVTQLLVAEAGFEPKLTPMSWPKTNYRSLKGVGVPKCQSSRLFNLFLRNFIWNSYEFHSYYLLKNALQFPPCQRIKETKIGIL